MQYKHKFVIDGRYSFYNNSAELEDNANFSSWAVKLVHPLDYVVVVNGFIDLTKDIISGSDYRFYAQPFFFPEVPTGCYKILIEDTVTGYVLYISKEFEIVASDNGLQYVMFRNARNMLNYNYEGLTDFNNRFHVQMRDRKPLRPTNTQGYEKSNGTFKRVRTTLKENREFVTGWFDKDEHDATQAMIVHSDANILLDGELKQVSASEETEYLNEWVENYEFIEALVRLEVNERASSNKAV